MRWLALLVLMAAMVIPADAARATTPLVQWHLDTAATTQSDASGNGFNGFSQGADFINSGRFGGAFSLKPSAAASGVTVGAATGLQPPAITVMLWVRSDGDPGAGTLASYGTPTSSCGTDSPSWQITNAGTDGTADVKFSVTGDGGVSSSSNGFSSGLIWDGDWHVLAFSYGLEGGASQEAFRTYLDGNEQDGGPSEQGAITYTSNPRSGFTIGSTGQCGDTVAPHVQVDEARLYDTALDATEVEYLSNRFHVVPPISTEQPKTELSVNYPLDGFTDTNPNRVEDTSGHGVHGDHVSGTISDAGAFGKSLDLGDSGGGYDVTSHVVDQNQAAVVAWVKGGSAPANRTIAGVGATPAQGCHPSLGLETDATGAVRMHLEGDTTTGGGEGPHTIQTFLSPTAPATTVWNNQWHGLAGVFADGKLSLFLDGAKVGTTDLPPASVYEEVHPPTFAVGRGPTDCETTGFGGTVDEVSLYGRDLTDGEAAYLTKKTGANPPHLPLPPPGGEPDPEPDLTLKWHLDSLDGGYAFDTSGNGLDGTPQHVGTFGPARFKGGVKVPADDGPAAASITAPDAAALHPADFTVMAWVRSTTPGDAVLLTQGSDGRCNGGAYALNLAGDSVLFYVQTDAGTARRGAAVPWDGQWHQIAASYDHHVAQVYVDGVATGAGTPMTGNVKYASYPGGFRVGGPLDVSCPADRQYHGDVDEVRLYSRALTADELAYLAAGVHRTPPTLPVPSGPRHASISKITGVPSPHNMLNCDPGTWEPADVTLTFLWERAPRSVKVQGDDAWAPIDGANQQLYTVQDTDVGSQVRCRVIATKGSMSTEALSANTMRVDAGPPQAGPAPVILGLPAVSGQPLTCDHGTWANVGEESEFTYTWRRDDGKVVGTDRTYTPTPTRAVRFGVGTVVNSDGDGNHDITCRVSAVNDVGPDISQSISKSAFVIDLAPTPIANPAITISSPNDPNPLNQTATCSSGTWADAYANHPDSGGTGYDFTYQWYRQDSDDGERTPIAGATGPTFKLIPDILGRNLYCAVTASNPLGTGTQLSGKAIIKLPADQAVGQASLQARYRPNENDPTNLIAYTHQFSNAVVGIIQQRDREMVGRIGKACAPGSASDARRQFDKVTEAGTYRLDVTDPDQLAAVCWIIKSDPGRLLYDSQLFYRQNSQPGCGSGYNCIAIPLPIDPVEPNTAAGLSDDDQNRIKPYTPERVLWDIDNDGHTDISCPGTAPVVRTKLDIGEWNPHAVIVNPVDSYLPRVVSVSYGQLYFPNANTVGRNGSNRGVLRKAQPMWCRNSFVPPPDPKLSSCVSSATIGAAQLSGNLCPVNVRGISQDELNALPEPMRVVIRAAAKVVNDNEFYSDVAKVQSTRMHFGERAVRSAADGYVAAAANNAAATFSAIGPQGTKVVQTGLEQAQQAAVDKLGAATGVDPNTAPAFALDQIYAASGDLNLNGITIAPKGDLHTIIAPSDVANGFKNDAEGIVHKMTINTPDAEEFLGKIPLSPGKEALNEALSDAKNQADKTFKSGIDLASDQMKAAYGDLADRLNTGPFTLAGTKVKVDLNPDGTATLSANAALPDLTGSDKSSIAIGVKIKADLQGHLQLQGLSLNVGEAYLLGIHLKNLFLGYDTNRLEARGQVTFGFLGGAGLDIKEFAINTSGKLEALRIAYLAGAGQGFPVGPGLFLTKVGGGFSAPDPVSLDADAALSVTPSTGEGCPTVGINGNLHLKVSPLPVELTTTADEQLFCIDIAQVDFRAETDGNYADAQLAANLDLDVPAIVHLKGGFNGHIHTKPNNWQIGADGSAKFKFIPATVSLKGVLSSRGIAACGTTTIPTPWPFDDLTLAAGAGVKFPGGVPPFTTVAIIANFRAFTGCDLGDFKPLGRIANRSGTVQSFPLNGKSVAVSIEGAGAEPRVTLVSPSGKRYDFTDADNGKFMDGEAFGAVLPTEDRTVVMLRKPQPGMWSAQTAAGSAQIVRVQQAPVLPAPSVKGKVAGHGSTRTLKYRIKKIAGQTVTLVEQANGASTILKTVKGGGAGTLHYTVGVAHGPKRVLEAQVAQGGLPRTNITVARYAAPNPKLTKPKVRVRRKGTTAVVSWTRPKLATGYAIDVRTSDGQNRTFSRGAKAKRFTVKGVGKRGGVVAKVTARGQARTATGTGKLKVTHKPKSKPHKHKTRAKHKKKKKHKQ